MSAVVVRLPGSAPMDTVAAAQLSEALSWAHRSVSAIVDRMLQTADDTLFSMAEASASDDDRRHLFDTMRILRKTAPAIIREFNAGLHPQTSVVRSLDGGELSLLDDSAVEADIVISRIASRIDTVAKRPLWEFVMRLENVPTADGLRISFEKLRPSDLSRAFNAAIAIDVIDSSAKLILFKLFERQLLSDSCPFYDGLNIRLDAAGVSSKAISKRTGAGSRLGSALHAPDHRAQPPDASSYRLPAQLWDLLNLPQTFSGARVSSAQSYDLPVGAARGGHDFHPLPGAGQSSGQIDLQSVGSVQRITLVNQLLDEMAAGRDETEGDALRRLLVPLIRIALSDGQFFGDHRHPARELLSSLGQPASDLGDRITAAESALHSMQEQLVLPRDVAPLGSTDLHQFLLDQRTTRHTTAARLDEARQAAHVQVKSVGSGRDLPAGMASFLTQVWLPLVSALHIRFGEASPEIARTQKLLEKLFGECRWVPGMDDHRMVGEILEDLDRELRQISVPPSLIQKAKLLLNDGLVANDGSRNLLDLETFSSRPPQPTGSVTSASTVSSRFSYPGDTASWRSALPPGSWFRIFDRVRDKTLWVASGIVYPQATSLAFSGFDPEAKIAIDRLVFLGDLSEGKAEPVDPTEPQTSAIRLLCLEYQRLPKSSATIASA